MTHPLDLKSLKEMAEARATDMIEYAELEPPRDLLVDYEVVLSLLARLEEAESARDASSALFKGALAGADILRKENAELRARLEGLGR